MVKSAIAIKIAHIERTVGWVAPCIMIFSLVDRELWVGKVHSEKVRAMRAAAVDESDGM